MKGKYKGCSISHSCRVVFCGLRYVLDADRFAGDNPGLQFPVIPGNCGWNANLNGVNAVHIRVAVI